MPLTFLAALIVLVWDLWLVADAARGAVKDARLRIPEGRRRGLRNLPVLLIVPPLLWTIAWWIDRPSRPWGSAVVGLAHVMVAIVLTVSLSKNVRLLGRLDDDPNGDKTEIPRMHHPQ